MDSKPRLRTRSKKIKPVSGRSGVSKHLDLATIPGAKQGRVLPLGPQCPVPKTPRNVREGNLVAEPARDATAGVTAQGALEARDLSIPDTAAPHRDHRQRWGALGAPIGLEAGVSGLSLERERPRTGAERVEGEGRRIPPACRAIELSFSGGPAGPGPSSRKKPPAAERAFPKPEQGKPWSSPLLERLDSGDGGSPGQKPGAPRRSWGDRAGTPGEGRDLRVGPVPRVGARSEAPDKVRDVAFLWPRKLQVAWPGPQNGPLGKESVCRSVSNPKEKVARG
jgi:hypothetical protein